MPFTDPRLVFKELQEQKHALDQSAIVAATDKYGRITYVNNKFCEISGYTREELLGQTHKIVNSSHHDKNFFKNLWEVISSGQTWHGEIRNRRKDGSEYWVHTTIVPFLDAESKIYQYLSIRQDITALKEAQETIVMQHAQMIAASKLSALGELSAALTHEINNPLGVILGRSEMLLSNLKSPDVDISSAVKMVESIQSTAQRIEKIMRTVRSLSHGGDREPYQRITLEDLISSVTDIMGARFKNHNIRLTIEICEPKSSVTCRPTEIFQILINLLSNSFDAVVDMAAPWVELKVSRLDVELYRFRITDSGQPIAADVQAKLFKPFFTTKGVGAGTGLGLTISHSLAEKNSATLSYCEYDGHTSFALDLPERVDRTS